MSGWMASSGLQRTPGLPLPPERCPSLHPGRRGPGDRSAEQIAEIQRARLRGGLVASISKRGYGGLTVDEVARLARVSKRDLYRHFRGGLHDCFLDVFDQVSAFVLGRVAEGCGEADGPEAALGAYVIELMQLLREEPSAARLLLLEPFAVGQFALRRMHALGERIEAMLASDIARMRGEQPPPLLSKAIVAGILALMRRALIMNTERELARSVQELTDWMLCSAWAPCAVRTRAGDIIPARIATDLPPVSGAGDEESQRQRILIATVRLASERGWAALCERDIREAAGVSCGEFRRFFGGKLGAFLAAVELLWGRAIAHASAVGAYADCWTEGLHRGVRALMECLIADPAFARLSFVDLVAAGADGVRGSDLLIGGVARRLRATVPRSRRPGTIAAHASVAAATAVVRHRVHTREIERLRTDAPMLSFVALAPAVGVERAAEAVGARRTACGGVQPPAPADARPQRQRR